MTSLYTQMSTILTQPSYNLNKAQFPSLKISSCSMTQSIFPSLKIIPAELYSSINYKLKLGLNLWLCLWMNLKLKPLRPSYNCRNFPVQVELAMCALHCIATSNMLHSLAHGCHRANIFSGQTVETIQRYTLRLYGWWLWLRDSLRVLVVLVVCVGTGTPAQAQPARQPNCYISHFPAWARLIALSLPPSQQTPPLGARASVAAIKLCL